MNRWVCIHGHFYQPPRENPWLEKIEIQDSAYPFHDWNERITTECYGPNTASRILDSEKRIVDIVNNYSKISFNFGPTLLSWMERHDPEVYKAVIQADGESQPRFSGHGSAMAQAYNHIIMPLAERRDKQTQVIWGIKDFEHRFRRKPEGMWLPETAVDVETLEIMAEQDIKFIVLAPHQARRVRERNGREWKDVSKGTIDPKIPYICPLPSGRSMNVFFYDGPISHDIAFGGLLKNGEHFARRIMGAFIENNENSQLVHIATDGESYGHHTRFGDMALAYCLHHIESNNLARITTYGEYLEKQPPLYEVELSGDSSWSCLHGVERWRKDCGCNSGIKPGWNQKWRAALREAMDWLREELIPVYEREMGSLMEEPWRTREDYISVILDRSVENVESFLSQHASKELSGEEKVKALKLLEMQRNAMLMYTSCGWFFDDISGIEAVQVMRYAGRAIQLAREAGGQDFEPHYTTILEKAQSNVPEYENGARVYQMLVKPSVIDLIKVGAHYAVSSLFEEYPEVINISCYTANSDTYDLSEAGKHRLAVGKANLRSNIIWEEEKISFAVLHFGDHNLIGGVRNFSGDHPFSIMEKEIKDSFSKSDIPGIINLMDKHFGTHNYSLRHLFRDEKRKVMSQILATTLKELEAYFRQIFENHYPALQAMKDMNIPLPAELSTPVRFILNTDLRKLLENEKLNFKELHKLVDEFKKWPFKPDQDILDFVAVQRINSLMKELSEDPENLSLLLTIEELFKILSDLALDLNLWKSQNIYFSLTRELFNQMEERAEKGDQNAGKWMEHIKSIGNYLGVQIT
jgi:alpha-amylase/alpha-mannosidase (GH57 family)